jgi:hypothetical protein
MREAAAFRMAVVGGNIREVAACRIQMGVGHILAVVGARQEAAVAVVAAVQRNSPTESRPTPVDGLNAKASFVTPCGLSSN